MRSWSICTVLLFSFVPIAEAQGQETGASLCSNEADDDGDSLIDAEDPDCAGAGLAPPPDAPPEDTTADTSDGDTAQSEPTGWPEPEPAQGGRREYTWDPAVLDALTRPDVEELYPQRHALQPLTYARGMLVPQLSLAVTRVPGVPGAVSDTVAFAFGLGASYGIFDFWEVSLHPLSFQLAPVDQYLDPVLETRVRFFETRPFEMGFATQLFIPVRGDTRWTLSLPLLFHLGEIGRIDLTPVSADILFASADTFVLLSARLRLAFQITQYAFLGAHTGVGLGPSDYGSGGMPLGFFVGGTIPAFDEGPLMQLELEFLFPSFVRFGPGGSDVFADLFAITLNARVFLYLLGGES